MARGFDINTASWGPTPTPGAAPAQLVPAAPPARGPTPRGPMSRRTKFLIGGGVAALVIALLASNKRVRRNVAKAVKVTLDTLQTEAGALAFRASLLRLDAGVAAQSFASVYLDVGQRLGVSPFVLAAIVDHESRAGNALAPKGAGGTGDRIPRWLTDAQLAGPYAPYVSNLTGRVVNPGDTFPDSFAQRNYGMTAKVKRSEMAPPTLPGAASPGWAGGIGQIDLVTSGAPASFFTSGDWKDPTKNVEMAATILKQKIAAISAALPNLTGNDLIVAGLAAYNRGQAAVVQSLKAGQPADGTSQPNGAYGADRFAMAQKAAGEFQQKAS